MDPTKNERGRFVGDERPPQTFQTLCPSTITQFDREFTAFNYLAELAHVHREACATQDERVARLAATLIARAPAELARLLEVRP
jgi:hypothetical protein